MSRRNPGKAVLLSLFAVIGAACGVLSQATAADLEIPKGIPGHAGMQHAPAAIADRADVSGSIIQRKIVPVPEIENARAAQTRFLQLRAAMDREMSYRRVLSGDELAALDGNMKQLSAELSVLIQSGHLPSPSKARNALDLAQDWYDVGLKAINPPAAGVTELPVPMSVSDKADRVASALDEVLEEANVYASGPRPAGLAKKTRVCSSRPHPSCTWRTL
jgi:hypothetical protein